MRLISDDVANKEISVALDRHDVGVVLSREFYGQQSDENPDAESDTPSVNFNVLCPFLLGEVDPGHVVMLQDILQMEGITEVHMYFFAMAFLAKDEAFRKEAISRMVDMINEQQPQEQENADNRSVDRSDTDHQYYNSEYDDDHQHHDADDHDRDETDTGSNSVN